MALFIDLFGYWSVILHGLSLVAQSMALGGALFLVLLAHPLAPRLGDPGPLLLRDTARITAWSAVALILCEAAGIALQTALLVGTIDLTVGNVLGADFAIAGMAKITCAVLLLLALAVRHARVQSACLLVIVLAALIAATLTTHAASRLENRGVLLILEGLHQLGAAIWIGGIPCFVLALARVHDGGGWRRVGARFSAMSIAGVGCILASGIAMSLLYIGSWQGFYGTPYGAMVGAKIALFLLLLALGAGNFLLVERLRRDPAVPVIRLKRFAEVEIGIGFAVFFAAASLTSAPPAVDFVGGEHGQAPASWNVIATHYAPRWPILASPPVGTLALPALHRELAAEAVEEGTPAPEVFPPGAGQLPPRNRADIAWSEVNHHWAGIIVLAIGLLALANQAGLRWARHWPLLFVGLAGFLFLRADPEIWPLGYEGLLDSLRDSEVFQHRLVVLLVLLLAWLEWRVRAGRLQGRPAALAFPVLSLLGGMLLLTHNHAGGSAQEQLVIELAHIPVALLAIVAAGARWLELRLAPPADRVAGWIWPLSFTLIALVLLMYRE